MRSWITRLLLPTGVFAVYMCAWSQAPAGRVKLDPTPEMVSLLEKVMRLPAEPDGQSPAGRVAARDGAGEVSRS